MAPAVIGQVCAELAAAGGVSAGPTVWGGFLSNCPGARAYSGAKIVPSACTTAGLWPEFTVVGERDGDWLQGFRFKLQTLRDAILATAENDRTATQQHEERCSWGPRVVGEPEELLDGVDVLPEVVERALERSRCGEAFVFAVQVISRHVRENSIWLVMGTEGESVDDRVLVLYQVPYKLCRVMGFSPSLS